MTSNGDSITSNAEASTDLVRLQSKDHEEILDVIDQLRSEGIGKYINLPQLIVCGDQSSGKSSVLEAISGLSFPRKDNLCTRFATELILRRAPQASVNVSIHPDKERSSAEQNRIGGFKSPTHALNRFEDIVKSAEEAIGVGRDGPLFFKDVLRVEVSGPDQPHLTLVDLPGLYHAADEYQTEEGVAFVESLVKSYMENSRSVMLAVISAKNDIALQKVTAFTRKVDPKGERTMGIITKPDTLPQGSEMEQSFVDLAQNKRVNFRLGWHVLKNRTFEERDYSLPQRNEAEADFLAKGIWSSMPHAQVGVTSLRPRLSTVLKAHMLSQLPGFITDTQLAFAEMEAGLARLGSARQTLVEQRRYLLQSSERFSSLFRNSIDGIYFDSFFGDAAADAGYERRLRAVVQNRLTDFAQAMSERGEDCKIIDDGGTYEGTEQWMFRSAFVEAVQQRMRRSRGGELPGTFNPLIVGDLFYAQTRPWKRVVDEYTDILLEDVRRLVAPALRGVLDEQSMGGLLSHIVNPRLTKLEKSLRIKTAELLQPQCSGHPITYNHYFTETIQKVREQHRFDAISKQLRSFFASSYPADPAEELEQSFSMHHLASALASRSDTDMERFACSEAIDCMLAYYKVALKKFVDDFSNLAIEKCLLEPLLDIFGPRNVDMMAEDIIENIASEDESTRLERKRLTDKLTVLENSLLRLHRLDKYKLTSNGKVSQDAVKMTGEIKAEAS